MKNMGRQNFPVKTKKTEKIFVRKNNQRNH